MKKGKKGVFVNCIFKYKNYAVLNEIQGSEQTQGESKQYKISTVFCCFIY